MSLFELPFLKTIQRNTKYSIFNVNQYSQILLWILNYDDFSLILCLFYLCNLSMTWIVSYTLVKSTIQKFCWNIKKSFNIFVRLSITFNLFPLTVKSKITKILNSEENQFGKSIITWQNQITKRIKNEWTRTVIFRKHNSILTFKFIK